MYECGVVKKKSLVSGRDGEKISDDDDDGDARIYFVGT